MEEREKLIILYEYYGKLLKPNQQKYFIDYYFDNLSLTVQYLTQVPISDY